MQLPKIFKKLKSTRLCAGTSFLTGIRSFPPQRKVANLDPILQSEPKNRSRCWLIRYEHLGSILFASVSFPGAGAAAPPPLLARREQRRAEF